MTVLGCQLVNQTDDRRNPFELLVTAVTIVSNEAVVHSLFHQFKLVVDEFKQFVDLLAGGVLLQVEVLNLELVEQLVSLNLLLLELPTEHVHHPKFTKLLELKELGLNLVLQLHQVSR